MITYHLMNKSATKRPSNKSSGKLKSKRRKQKLSGIQKSTDRTRTNRNKFYLIIGSRVKKRKRKKKNCQGYSWYIIHMMWFALINYHRMYSNTYKEMYNYWFCRIIWSLLYSFCTDGKTFKKPRRSYENERLVAELKLVGEYELWLIWFTVGFTVLNRSRK